MTTYTDLSKNGKPNEIILPIAFQDITTSTNYFKTIEDRNPFIRKIYCNLTFMWAIITITCYGFMYNNTLNKFANTNDAYLIFILSALTLVISVLMSVCSEQLIRRSPYDYIILSIYTLSEAYILGYTCAFQNSKAVFLAAITTLIITVSMSIFACQTTYDCTGMGGFLFASLSGIICINIVNLFVKSNSLNLWAACGSVILFTMYIVYDTQLIIGGNHHRYKYSIDDHVFATITLHLDMVNLFLNLLQLFSNND